MKPLYFDYASTTPVDTRVIDKMKDCLSLDGNFGNPGSRSHAFGWQAEELVEEARLNVSNLLNCDPREIIWTSGATESDNLAIKGAANFYKEKGKHIITSKIEHKAVLDTCRQLESEGFEITYLDPDENGTISIKSLQENIRKDTTLVSLMHINNEIGTILDIKYVASLCKKHKALFHSDTVQSVGHYNLDLSLIPIDFLAASAHKFHGPKGIGFAFVRNGLGLQPIITGGAQERGCRAGTESIHDIVGLDTALSIAYQNLESEKQYIQSLKSYFIDRLKAEVTDVRFNGCCDNFEKSTYTLVNVCLPVSIEKTPLFLFQLDLKGIACSKGSACQSGSDSGSHVLREFLSEEALKKPSIRFSFSKYNTKSEIDEVVGVLKDLVLEPA